MMRSPLAWMFTVVLALLALSLFVSIFQTLAWVIAPLALLFAGLRLHRVAVVGPPASTQYALRAVEYSRTTAKGWIDRQREAEAQRLEQEREARRHAPPVETVAPPPQPASPPQSPFR